jgi:NOL1/NOP2/fmu family ribosome biogenesis protein
MDHWSLSAVEHCAARQRRILKDIWPSLKEGGRLLYSTCSFSEAEDEEVVSWMQQEWDIVLNKIDLPAEWGVVETNYGYRCWPHLIKGEGFFIAPVQKMSSESILSTRTKFSIKSQPNAPTAFLGDWWERDQHELIDWKDMCWAIPSNRMADIQLIGSVCQPYRLGTCLGAWSRKDWIPDHALALSRYVQRTLPQLELDKDEAIRYLQRGAIDRAGLERGWLLATFQGRPMGWLKNIGNRMNNYYPSHLRILKQSVSPDQ